MQAAESSQVIKPDSEARQERDEVTQAIKNAKAKNDRLRLLKARNENYLAEQREERETDEEETKEL
jgi:hypothetical protein